MPVHVKAEPSSPERGLPPSLSALHPSRETEDDSNEVEVMFDDEPQTPQVPTSRGRGSASSKRKSQASGSKKAAADKEWNYTYMPAGNEARKRNGRVEGRNLITWNRPRMAEKLLLHIMYECSRHRVDIPWDQVAHRLHPGSTGGAIVQHLNRLRANLIAEGHMVPPICQKPGSRVAVDPNIRGYIRKFPESDDTATTRPVRFDEPLEDRRFNLPDAWDTMRGNSIRYDAPSPGLKRPTTALAPGMDPITALASSSPATRGSPSKRGRGGKKTSGDRGIKREASPDPAFLDSDSDYAPGPKPARKQARRSARSKKTYTDSYTVDSEFDEEEEEELPPKKVQRKKIQQQATTPSEQSDNRSYDDGPIEIQDDIVQNTEASHNVNGSDQDQRQFLGNSYGFVQNGANYMSTTAPGYGSYIGGFGHGGSASQLPQIDNAAPMPFSNHFSMPAPRGTEISSMASGLNRASRNPMLSEEPSRGSIGSLEGVSNFLSGAMPSSAGDSDATGY